MPLSECRRRSENDVPWPGRSGATPPLTTGVVVVGAGTTKFLKQLGMMGEPIIMLARQKGSQMGFVSFVFLCVLRGESKEPEPRRTRSDTKENRVRRPRTIRETFERPCPD